MVTDKRLKLSYQNTAHNAIILAIVISSCDHNYGGLLHGVV